jgi:hypothetical protein
MLRRIAVARCDGWTQILEYLDETSVHFSGVVKGWESEVEYLIEEDIYRVTIKIIV